MFHFLDVKIGFRMYGEKEDEESEDESDTPES